MGTLRSVAVALILSFMVIGCGVDEPRFIEEMTTIKDTLQTLVKESPNRYYTLVDLAAKDPSNNVVATVLTGVAIGKGDRIYIGTDMWDVTDVKVHLSDKNAMESSNGVKLYTKIAMIELLVKYQGKKADGGQGAGGQ